MEGTPEGYPRDLVRYTAIQLPNPGESAIDGTVGADASRTSSARRERDRRSTCRCAATRLTPTSGPRADRALRDSPYAPMYEQALELTRDQPTAYDAVKSVELWLQDNFTYSERVPTHPIPLMGFLEEDKRGYCQQFSGTMALMLRMSGIPARVAAGFSPGSYNKDTREYRVRDLDAHSWVEVWFTGHRLGAVRPDAGALARAVAVERARHERGGRRRGRGARLRLGVAAVGAAPRASADLGGDGGGGLGPARADRSCCWWPPLGRRRARARGAGRTRACGRCRRTRSRTLSCPSSAARSCGSDGTCRSPRPCSGSSGGSGASPAPRRRRTPARCGRTATTRARRPPRAWASGARVRRELTRGSVLDRLRGFLAIPPGAPRS